MVKDKRSHRVQLPSLMLFFVAATGMTATATGMTATATGMTATATGMTATVTTAAGMAVTGTSAIGNGTAAAYPTVRVPDSSRTKQQDDAPDSDRRPRPPQIVRASILEDLSEAFQRRPRPPQTTRSDSVCLISPGQLEEDGTILGDRPVVFWSIRGDASLIQLQRVRVVDENLYGLWEDPLTNGTQSRRYAGETLEPGQSYELWIDFNAWNSNELTWETREARGSFRIMDTESRNRITAELDALTRELRTTGADAETIALQQALFLAERSLYSDALQILEAIDSPSSEVQTTLQNILTNLTQQLCPIRGD